MASSIIAMAVAALVIGGAATVVVFWPDGGEGGGWYSWEPTVADIGYSKISATQRIIEPIEQMYEAVYGKLPAKMAVPDDKKLTYESLVEPLPDGGIKIKSPRSGVPDATVSFTKNEIEKMRIVSYASSFTDSYVSMLGDDVWDTVVAAGKTTWDNYPNHGMSGKMLGSEFTLSAETILDFLKGADNEYTYCLVMWGWVQNYDTDTQTGTNLIKALESYSNVKILCVDYYSIKSFEYLLSVVDALGQLIGKDAADNDAMKDFQDRLYTVKSSVPSGGRQNTVYMELASGSSPGKDTLTQLCFDVLNLRNINTTAGTNKLNDEVVVASRPNVIFFDTADSKRTIGQKMRVDT
jgi:ABC-type hemin transport system substrate-binding protein